jgi:hypothetical protein
MRGKAEAGEAGKCGEHRERPRHEEPFGASLTTTSHGHKTKRLLSERNLS